MRKKLWFSPKTHSGWSKTDAPVTRRRKLLASVPRNWTMHRRYVTAGKKAQALSNVSQDKVTSMRAKTDANYFFRKARNL